MLDRKVLILKFQFRFRGNVCLRMTFYRLFFTTLCGKLRPFFLPFKRTYANSAPYLSVMHFFQKDFEEYFVNFKINEKFLGIKNYASVKSANIGKIAKLMEARSERV